MSAYSNNLWAEEMGIDLEELKKERPFHLSQLKLKRKYSRQADKYWERQRFLAQFNVQRKGVTSPVTSPVTLPEPEVEKVAPKTTKVGRYEFTDRQLEIAKGVLDARDSM